MSMLRPRGGAAAGSRRRTRPADNAPVYEDFKPTSERKHEEGADILLYHLPGFAKDQIKIVAESRGILRVRGERHVTSNRWSRFQEEVVVPGDCNMSEIRAKFDGGILRIIMPKKMVITNKKNPIEEQSNTSTSHEPPTPSVTRPNIQPKPQPKLQDEVPSMPSLPTIPEMPRFGSLTSPPTLIHREGDDKPVHKKQQEPTMSPLKPPIDTKPHSQANQDYTNQHIPDYLKPNVTYVHKAPEDFSSVMDSKRGEGNGTTQTSRIKQNEIIDKREEVISGVQESHAVYDDALDHDYAGIDETNESKRFGDQNRVTESHMSRNFKEDGQLLINMGAAVLVIVALGTYISYSFGLGD